MPTYQLQLPDGRKMDIESPDEKTAVRDADNWFKSNPIDESIAGAIKYGTAGTLHGLESTANRVSEETGGDKTVTKALGDAATALDNPNYKPADAVKANGPAGPLSKSVYDFTGGWLGSNKNYDVDISKLPRSIAEAAPGIGAGLATFGASVPLTTMGPMADKAEAAKGAPLDARDKFDVGLKTAGVTALNMLPAGRLRAPMSQVGVKGAIQAATRPLEVGLGTGTSSAASAALMGEDPRAAFVQGGLTGGALAGARTPGNVYKAAKYSKWDDPAASAAVANRLKEHGAAPVIGRSKADEHAMRATAIDLRKDLAAEVANARANTGLNNTHEKILERAKKGEDLDSKDIDTIRSLGNDNLTHIVSQARAFGMLNKKGERSGGKFKGGLSGRFERWMGNPNSIPWKLAQIGGMVGGGALASGGMSGLNAAGSGGMLLPLAMKGLAPAGAAYGAMRLIDSQTGNRNPATSFVNKFADGTTKHSRPATPLQLQQQHAKAVHGLTKGFAALNKAQKAQAAAAAAPPAATATRPNIQGLLAQAYASRQKYNNMNDKQIADHLTADFVKNNPRKKNMATAYWKGIVNNRTKAEQLWATTVQNAPELVNYPDLRIHVKNASRRPEVKNIIEDIKHNVSPQTAAVIDSLWTKKAIHSIWSK